MSSMGRDPTDADIPSEAISSEACAWIAQLETGALTPHDLSAFREWVGRSPRHAAEIQRLAHLAEDVNLVAGMQQPLELAIESFQPMLAAQRRRGMRWLTVAAAVLIAVAGLFIALDLRQAPQPLLIATALGDYRTETLPDGSVVKLNSNSQIEVNYSRDLRRVRLLKGEAFFTVAHDEKVPFLVFAQEKYVRAVGTAFSVRMSGADLAVLVTDGVVELNDSVATLPQAGSAPVHSPSVGAASPPGVRLRAGQGMTIALEEEVRPEVAAVVALSEREVQRTLAWREGLLDFTRTPLEEVVAEVSRHTALQIEIADPSLRELQFDGMFRVGQVDELLVALGEAFQIKVERIGDDRVRLSRR